MENLDKYLKKIEETANIKVKEYEIQLNGFDEPLKIRTLSLEERREWQYSIPANGIKTIGDILNNQTIRKIIYEVMDLKKIAVAAKERGLINTYYDVLDYMFTVDNLLDIVKNITDHIDGDGVDDLKN